jgi:hypothetical protein
MMSTLLRTVAVFTLLAVAGADARPADDEKAFTPIFDGKTLDGWTAPDMSFWRVEDGAITGEVTKDHRPKENVFLVWKGEPVGDFELRFQFRIFGDGSNSGMQFRSEVKERGLVHGYQADISGDGKWVGGIFDEYGPRGSLAARGQRVTFDREGKKTIDTFPDPLAGEGKIDLTQWTDYHVIAVGPHISLKINGKATAELTDLDPRARATGVLAVPVITTPMKVQFKDVRLKRSDGKR